MLKERGPCGGPEWDWPIDCVPLGKIKTFPNQTLAGKEAEEVYEYYTDTIWEIESMTLVEAKKACDELWHGDEEGRKEKEKMNDKWWIVRDTWFCTRDGRMLLTGIEEFRFSSPVKFGPVLNALEKEPEKKIVYVQSKVLSLPLKFDTEEEAREAVDEISKRVEKALGLSKE